MANGRWFVGMWERGHFKKRDDFKKMKERNNDRAVTREFARAGTKTCRAWLDSGGECDNVFPLTGRCKNCGAAPEQMLEASCLTLEQK